jgi:hypothetical protein
MNEQRIHLTVEITSVDAIERTPVITYDNCEELLAVTSVGPNLYQLNENPLLADAQYGDVIEVERLPDGALRLLRVAQASGLERLGWLVSLDLVTSSAMTGFLANILAMGGYWEACVGMLTLNVPKAQKARVEAEFLSIMGRIDNARNATS